MHHHLDLRAKLIIMISVLASFFLVALDQTIVSTALGKIVEEFNAFTSLSLIVTAYLLTTTVTVPIAGKLSDIFGRRTLLLFGVAIFGVGSLLSGLAGTIDALIWARAFQGIGGGIITANAFTIIGDLFPPRERSRWQGLIGAVFGISSLVGPLLGGWLTDGQNLFGLTTDWRWTFYLNVPIAIVAFILIAIFSPALRREQRPKVDYLGATFLTIALGTLVLAVDNTDKIFKDVMENFDLSLVGLRVIMGVIVAVSLGLFIWTEKRHAQEPILPPANFKKRNYALIVAIASLFGAAFLGSILYLTQFNQQVFGATPTESGLMLLPMVAGIMTSSITSGQLIARFGKYKRFMEVGIVVATIMVGLLATLTPESSYLQEAVIMVFIGLGLGLVMPVLNIAVQAEFKQSELGVATSSVQLFRGLGSTIGIALFGALLTSGITTNLGDVPKDDYIATLQQQGAAKQIGDLNDPNTLLTLNTPDVKEKITDGFEKGMASSQIPEPAQKQVTEKFKENQASYANKITHAFSDSLRVIFLTSAGLMVIASALVFFLKERKLSQHIETAETSA